MVYLTVFDAKAIVLGVHEDHLPQEIKDLNLDISDNYSYSFVRNYCHDNTISGLHQIYKDSYMELVELGILLNSNQYKSRKHYKGMGAHLSTILDSYGFYLALNDCFGDNQRLKNQFTAMLIGADTVGTLTGGVTGSLSWILGGGLLSYVGKKLGIKFLTSKKLQRGILISAVAIPTGFAVVKIYQEIEARNIILQRSEIKLKEIENEILSIENDINAIEPLLHSRTKEDNELGRDILHELEKQLHLFEMKKEKLLENIQ